MPTVGDAAPDFELQTDRGEAVRLSDFRGKKVVLFFYPKADTPGCIKESCGFRDDYRAFQDRDVVVLGISPDTVASQAKFSQKYGFPYRLLADADHEVAAAYGVWKPKKLLFLGIPYVMRTTFLISEAGHITLVFEGVNPRGHSQEILAAMDGAAATTA